MTRTLGFHCSKECCCTTNTVLFHPKLMTCSPHTKSIEVCVPTQPFVEAIKLCFQSLLKEDTQRTPHAPRSFIWNDQSVFVLCCFCAFFATGTFKVIWTKPIWTFSMLLVLRSPFAFISLHFICQDAWHAWRKVHPQRGVLFTEQSVFQTN